MVLNNNWKKIGLTQLFTLTLEHAEFIDNMSQHSHIRPVAQECINNLYLTHNEYGRLRSQTYTQPVQHIRLCY
jgi:hypothetical protein